MVHRLKNTASPPFRDSLGCGLCTNHLMFKQTGDIILYPSAGEWCFSGPWLSRTGAEGSYTAGVTVTVPHHYTHYASHGHMSFWIYREKQRERG